MQLLKSFPLTALAVAAALLPSTASMAEQIINIPAETVHRLMEKRLPPGQTFVPGEVIVKMKPGTRSVAPRMMGAMGISMKDYRTSGGEMIYRVEPVSMERAAAAAAPVKSMAERTLDLVKSLQQQPDVEYAQPNYVFQIAAQPNDPSYSRQWHYFDRGAAAGQSPGGIGLPTVWGSNTGSSSVVVAVVDTGILPNHPDIKGSPNLVAGYDMISNASTANDGDGRDADPTDTGDGVAANECGTGYPELPSSWHGTHVSGTIGVGKTNNGVGVAGVNWNVKVQPVRALGKCGGTMTDINDAIRWAAGLTVPGVPVNPTPAKVINMSLGGYGACSSAPALQAAINDAIAKGVTVVAAAGNEAMDASQSFPASCTGVITVAASDNRGYLVTSYSNYGSVVDIMAPGGDVSTDLKGGILSMVDGGYAYYNGTSMAAPHVAGVAALLLAKDPSLTPAQIRNTLKSNALPRNSSECPKPCGAGLLSALPAGSGTTTPPVDPTPTGWSITMTPSVLNLSMGMVTQGNASLFKNDVLVPGQQVTFTSSNPGIFTVDPAMSYTNEYGVATTTVTAMNDGSAQLIATSNGVQATANVFISTSSKSSPALPAPLFGLLLGGLWFLGRRRR